MRGVQPLIRMVERSRRSAATCDECGLTQGQLPRGHRLQLVEMVDRRTGKRWLRRRCPRCAD